MKLKRDGQIDRRAYNSPHPRLTGLPSPEYVRTRLLYCSETGRLFWKHSADVPEYVNKRLAGKEAFTASDGHSFRGILDGRGYKAHRVIWAIVKGEWPVGEIDHIDQNPHNNRIENLRIVSRGENLRNLPMSRKNKSGVNGIHWDSRKLVWVAQISDRGRKRFLGRFKKIEDAISARSKAERDLGFSENHGRNVGRIKNGGV